MSNSWSGASCTPGWREDQELQSEKLDVRIPLVAEGTPKLMSRVSFAQFGLIGSMSKATRTKQHTRIRSPPKEMKLRMRIAAPDIPDPDRSISSCLAAVHSRFLCKEGRMATWIPNKFSRDLLRHQFIAFMATKLTQASLPSLEA